MAFHQNITDFPSTTLSRSIEIARPLAETGPSYQPFGREHNEQTSQKLVRGERQLVPQFAWFCWLSVEPDRHEPSLQNNLLPHLPCFLDQAGHFSNPYKRGQWTTPYP